MRPKLGARMESIPSAFMNEKFLKGSKESYVCPSPSSPLLRQSHYVACIWCYRLAEVEMQDCRATHQAYPAS